MKEYYTAFKTDFIQYDTVLSIPMESFRKTHEESFAGTSHDKITLEVYRR